MCDSREQLQLGGKESPQLRGPVEFDRKGATVSSVAMENASNYFRWQYSVCSSHLTPRVLEVGCGIGGFTRTLLGRESVVSVDLNPEMITYLTAQLAAHAEWRGVVADLTDPNFASGIGINHCTSVAALNIIEHIRDDIAALKTIHSILPTGGKAAILVPAHNWLYSGFDVAVGHFRRYTISSLTTKVEAAGFHVDKAFYFNMIGALGWFANYKLLKITEVDEKTITQIGFFDRILVPLGKQVEKRIRPPFGISVIALVTAR